ncbi:MAG: hypothetical protein ACKVT1_03830 [Dehalococcoidia bacterium]
MRLAREEHCEHGLREPRVVSWETAEVPLVVVSKAKVLGVLESLPDEFELEEVMARLYLLARLDLAEREIVDDNGISPEEMRRRADTWRR